MEGNRDDAKRIPDTGYKLTGGGAEGLKLLLPRPLSAPLHH